MVDTLGTVIIGILYNSEDFFTSLLSDLFNYLCAF